MPVFVLFVHLILINDASSALNLVGPILMAEFKSEEKAQPITFSLDKALILDAIQPWKHYFPVRIMVDVAVDSDSLVNVL